MGYFLKASTTIGSTFGAKPPSSHPKIASFSITLCDPTEFSEQAKNTGREMNRKRKPNIFTRNLPVHIPLKVSVHHRVCIQQSKEFSQKLHFLRNQSRLFHIQSCQRHSNPSNASQCFLPRPIHPDKEYILVPTKAPSLYCFSDYLQTLPGRHQNPFPQRKIRERPE